MERFADYWESICQIYFLTKHYLLLSEELSDDFDTFLQPVKEHRDAFDHIARVYGYEYLQSEIKNVEQYREQNMKKALGHVYRAFFDTADWLSYIYRREIRRKLQGYSYDQIIRFYPNYKTLREDLIQFPKEIALLRQNKDISDNAKEIIVEVQKYADILDKLWDYYKHINTLF